MGLKQNKYDRCLYSLKGDNGQMVYLGLYVDDLLIAGADQGLIAYVKDGLAEEFKMKNLDKVNEFLGMKIARTDNGYVVNQTEYLRRVLRGFGMEQCNGANTPMDTGLDMDADQGDPIGKPELYRHGVGSLIFAVMHTRQTWRKQLASWQGTSTNHGRSIGMHSREHSGM